MGARRPAAAASTSALVSLSPAPPQSYLRSDATYRARRAGRAPEPSRCERARRPPLDVRPERVAPAGEMGFEGAPGRAEHERAPSRRAERPPPLRCRRSEASGSEISKDVGVWGAGPCLLPGNSSPLETEPRAEQEGASRLVVDDAPLGIDVDLGGEGRVQEVERLEAQLQLVRDVVARRKIEPRF